MTWQIALSDIDLGDEEIEAVIAVLRSKWLSMGEITQRFEQAFAEIHGVKHAFAVSNGTVALHLANAALGIGPGDEVIVPSLTFVATANAVRYTGATPVFADICGLNDFGISPRAITQRITPRTRAISVVHYGGYMCHMHEIEEIARQHNLSIIEDAAHAPGSELDGRKAGAWGDVGCFSFFSNKNMATGEGGMVVTNRDDLAERIRLMRSHGMTTLTWDRHRGHASSYDVVALGYNYRIDEIRSALGLAQLAKLAANNAQRRTVTDWYRTRLRTTEGLTIPYLEGSPGISSAHLFTILLDEHADRQVFINEMKARGIQTSIHYPPIHRFSYYQTESNDINLPLTEVVGARVVTLPLHAKLTRDQVEHVASAAEAALSIAQTSAIPN